MKRIRVREVVMGRTPYLRRMFLEQVVGALEKILRRLAHP
jgi:hypothetical protein